MKILIIDDKAENLYMLETLLKGNGYEVVSAANGKEALEKLRSEGAGMIISDILMPVMDGFQLCQEVTADETLRHIPFIFYTATYTDEKDEEFALKLGANKFLRKPMEPDKFVRIILDVIRDMEEGKLRPQKPALRKTEETFKLYSERLVKKLEKKMLDLEKEVDERKRTEERVKHLNLVLRAIRKVNQLIIQERDPDLLLQGVCDNLIENRGYYNAWIVLLDDTGRYVAAAEAGLGKDFLPIVERLKKGKMIDCVKMTQMQPEIVVIKDPPFACTDCPLAKRYRCRGGFAARLDHAGKVYGLLTVSIPGDSATDEEEQALFGEVARDIGYVLHNIELEKEQKQAQEALRESEEKFRGLYMSAPNAYFSVSATDGSIIMCNSAALHLLGYEREALQGKRVIDLYADTPDGKARAGEILRRFVAGETVRDVELQMKHRDGYPIWISLSVEPVRNDDGNVIESRSVVIDISERKRLESQLRQAQKMEAIGTLAGGIAHDFNNILSAIMGYSELSMPQASKETNLHYNLQGILRSGERARDLVKQILAFSRWTDQERNPIQMAGIVKEALKMLRSTLPTTIEIRQDIGTDQQTILADPTEIHQIVMNLCTNAAHAMREHGGVLEVSLESLEFGLEKGDPKIEENRSKIDSPDITPGSYMLFTVSDTGHGMGPGVVERIFDPYFTTKEKGVGTGMGLSVVHGLVMSYGGKITIHSEPGKGSTFNIYLPGIEREMISEAEEPEPLPTGNERILLIDDEPVLVDIGKQMLERLGYDVTTRTSSVDALELFKAEPDSFDLVITDMTMPNMTGDKLARKLMEVRPDIPVILCTGYSEGISREAVESIGIKDFLMKPIVAKKISSTVRNALDRT